MHDKPIDPPADTEERRTAHPSEPTLPKSFEMYTEDRARQQARAFRASGQPDLMSYLAWRDATFTPLTSRELVAQAIAEAMAAVDRRGQPLAHPQLHDRFAAALLMPEPWVRAVVAHGLAVNDISQTFGVSVSAVRVRLRQLRLETKGSWKARAPRVDVPSLSQN